MPNKRINPPLLQVILEGKIFEEQPRGGISRIYHEILPRICNMDERILFSIPVSDHPVQSLPQHPQIIGVRSGFPIHRFLRPQMLFWQMQDYLRARFQIASIQPCKNTIWHASYFHLPTWWAGPKVITVYDLIHEQFPQFFNKNYDTILRKRKKRAILAADKVICISKTVQTDAVNMYGLPKERAVAIPLASSNIFRHMSREEIKPSFRVDRPFILYVGSRSHYKNFKLLLSAYAAWHRKNEIALLVVGEALSKEEQKEIAAAGIEAGVACLSGVTDEELCSLYNQALAFVYPSLSEGFGIPLLEAMACGCQIVASRIPIFMEVAGDVPYFFDPLNKDELIAALEAACFSKSTNGSREAVLSNYSWDRNAKATLKIYKELSSGVEGLEHNRGSGQVD